MLSAPNRAFLRLSKSTVKDGIKSLVFIAESDISSRLSDSKQCRIRPIGKQRIFRKAVPADTKTGSHDVTVRRADRIALNDIEHIHACILRKLRPFLHKTQCSWRGMNFPTPSTSRLQSWERSSVRG